VQIKLLLWALKTGGTILKQTGDLDKASGSLQKQDFKI
jgi:hypothetical protein